MSAILLSLMLLGAAAEVQTRETPTTRLFVQTTPPGAAIKLDGKAEGAAPKVFLVPPGATKMIVEVELDGHASQRREVTIQGGRVTRIEFQLAPQQAKAPAGPPSGLHDAPENAQLAAKEPGATARVPASAAEPALVVFGPVIERTVEGAVSGKSAIDLDTGTLHIVPVGVNNDKAIHDWMQTNGVDALAMVGAPTCGLGGFDMVAMAVPNARWDVSISELEQTLATGKPGTPAVMTGRGALPATYFFKTREGGMGVLQIVGLMDNPSGVKIRYKLARSPAAVPAAQPTAGATSLAEAIRVFNARAAENPIGKSQPPLTEDEVIAAIRWSLLEIDKLAVSDKTIQALRRTIDSRELPPRFDLEVDTLFEPNDRMQVTMWSVRLRIPAQPQGTTCVSIREQMVGSRLFGDEEGKVIHKWQEKRRKDGIVLVPDREYEEKRARAAEIDRSRKTPDGKHAAAAPAPGVLSLAEAVRVFNARATENSVGKSQSPLTEDEVIAAIRWSLLDSKKLPVSDKTLQSLKSIPDSCEFPNGFELTFSTDFQPDSRTAFTKWLVRLRFPAEPRGTTDIVIRDRMIAARLSDAAAAKETFGPVIERVLFDYFEGWGEDVLDVDTGRLLDCPQTLSNGADWLNEWSRWVETEGADLRVHCRSGGEWMMSCADRKGKLGQVENSLWEATPAEIRRAIPDHQGSRMKPKPPVTFVFQTAQGRCGVLRIVACSTKRPHSVRLQYKLIRTAAEEPPARSLDLLQNEPPIARFESPDHARVGKPPERGIYEVTLRDPFLRNGIGAVGLDSHRTYHVPDGYTAWDLAAQTEWARKKGMDLLFFDQDLSYAPGPAMRQWPRDHWGLVAPATTLSPVAPGQWEKAEVSELRRILSGESPGAKTAGCVLIEGAGYRAYAFDRKATLPLTFALKTRNGSIGVLQVTDYSQLGGASVSIRYKIIDKANPAANTPTTLPATRQPGPPYAPAAPQPKTTESMPRRVHHFAALTTGNSVKIAYSADGKRIAIANGNPTFIMQGNGRSRVEDNWKPLAEILDAETGKTVVSLKLTTNDEDTLLAATERVPDFEVTALAFSPDGNVVAVGTTVGQVKLFNAHAQPWGPSVSPATHRALYPSAPATDLAAATQQRQSPGIQSEPSIPAPAYSGLRSA